MRKFVIEKLHTYELFKNTFVYLRIIFDKVSLACHAFVRQYTKLNICIRYQSMKIKRFLYNMLTQFRPHEYRILCYSLKRYLRCKSSNRYSVCLVRTCFHALIVIAVLNLTNHLFRLKKSFSTVSLHLR